MTEAKRSWYNMRSTHQKSGEEFQCDRSLAQLVQHEINTPEEWRGVSVCDRSLASLVQPQINTPEEWRGVSVGQKHSTAGTA